MMLSLRLFVVSTLLSAAVVFPPMRPPLTAPRAPSPSRQDPPRARPAPAPAEPKAARLDARAIQRLLDRDGYCLIPPGTHVIDEPIRLGPTQRLSGCGMASVLKFAGPGEWAILFGDMEKTNYGCYLDGLAVTGGGVWCRRFGQHCGIDKVWITRAPGDGLRIEGVGDKFLVRDLIAYENKGDGIVIRSGVSNNGLVLEHCNAQGNGGHGVLLESSTWGGMLGNALLRDCTIQGNGRGGRVKAEMMVRGWVHILRLENIWIESTQDKSGPLPVGIRVEASKPFADPKTGDPVVRRPAFFSIDGNSAIHLVPRAIEFAACQNIRIEQLLLAPKTARVYWRGDEAAGRSTHTTKPAGTMWLMEADRVVADPQMPE